MGLFFAAGVAQGFLGIFTSDRIGCSVNNLRFVVKANVKCICVKSAIAAIISIVLDEHIRAHVAKNEGVLFIANSLCVFGSQ